MAKRTKKVRHARRSKTAATKPMGASVARAPAVLASNDPVPVEPVEPVPQAAAEPAGVQAEPAPTSASSAALNDIDEAFFRQGEEIEAMPPQSPEDSIPPTTDDVEKQSLPPPPEVIRRRSKFRKFVGVVVVLCTLVVVGGMGKTIATERSASAAPGKARASSPVEAVKSAVVRQPRKIVGQSKPAAKPKASAPAEAPPEPAEAVAAAPEVNDPRKEALDLLNRGKVAEAIPMARVAIQRDPNHALGYLYLGTALQESGKSKEAIAAYGDCVRHAKQGPVWECRAMGGRE
jgi:tetratricopeptide (TPR) repeat protein